MTPKNQKQQALWYLINFNNFSLKTVINHSMFYKFQSRLSELESKHGLLAERKKQHFINTFGNESDYNLYQCIDKEKARQLFFKYEPKKGD